MHGLLPLPGDLVWIRRRRWRVERARRDRHIVRLDVADRDRRLTFLSPFDRVLTRGNTRPPRRVRAQEAMARLAHLLAHAGDARVPSAAVDARADILPHQLEPVMAMLAGRSRILIADEVGLGKTVEAGLAIAEIVRREMAPRVLVLAPAALRDQWAEELHLRFGIACLTADRSGLNALTLEGAFGDNPWRRSGVWLASADFLKQRHVVDSLPHDPWDLVVIDEAHAVCGDSDRYDLCHQLAARARRTMLLTATPHSGDDCRFARLMDLGRLGPDDEDATIFRRTRASLGQRPPRRVRWHRITLSDAETGVLAALAAFERVVTARSRGSEQALLLLSVFRKRALSTMSALSQSIARRLSWLGEAGPEPLLEWAQPRLEFEDEHDDVDREEREGLTAHSGLGVQQERSWLRRLRVLTDEAARTESKVERLVAFVHRSTEPVVVFTEFRDSLDVIRRRLRFSRPVSVLHGGQDASERRHQLRQFLDGSTSVLIATDVAGQGLNLQSRARWVISLELPWNPARLEQRIGRVDRISQTRPTHLTLLVARDDAESGLLLHLSRRVLAARRSFSADALESVTPPQAHVRAALLLHAPIEGFAAAPGVQICGRWARIARCAARMLIRQRVLAAAWRLPGALPGGRPICSHAGRVSRIVPHAQGAVLVFSVPILGPADALIERRVVAVAVDAGACDARVSTTIAALARPVVDRVSRRRVLAAAHRAQRISRAAIRREHAIAQSLEAELLLEEVQPGLFDLRETEAFEARLRDEERIEAASARRVAAEGAGDPIHAGEPVLEIVLSRRP